MFNKDKRHWARAQKSFRIDVIIVDPSNQETPFKLDPLWTRDVGGNGLGLVTSVHCMVGAVMDLQFQLPNREEPIHTRGRVVWSKLEDGSNSKYRIGIAFDNINKADQQAIINYVNEEASKSSGKRVS